jgi:hypothetical protein
LSKNKLLVTLKIAGENPILVELVSKFFSLSNIFKQNITTTPPAEPTIKTQFRNPSKFVRDIW